MLGGFSEVLVSGGAGFIGSHLVVATVVIELCLSFECIREEVVEAEHVQFVF